MRKVIERTAAAALVGLGLAGAALANVGTNVPAGVHTASETWTLAGSPYRLKGQVYFDGNSTLTIQAGVVVASLPADQGSLAICRGSQVFVEGTADQPVIMTSTNDVATWSGTSGTGDRQIPGDSKTGAWREANNEWGNLTLLGRAYISENAIAGNSAAPSATNEANMEGLVSGPATDRYGGGNDDDDSGDIRYLSLRYGGKVVGQNNELNGMSLGGIGRNTEINHVEVINNKDDGIEIWGGTVNLKYVVVYNHGDDAFDLDQGWRGKAQYGLICLGWSSDNATGSGVAESAFEMDGAEDSHYQPVTTATVYNFTAIGMPNQTAALTRYRDGARVQIRNSIFMQAGGPVITEVTTGDGGNGYAHMGTLSFSQTWQTPFNAVPPHANDPVGLPGFYAAQSLGNLNELSDNVFYANNAASAYTTYNTVSGLPGNANTNNVVQPASLPMVALGSSAPVLKGGILVQRVTSIDPRAANSAATSINRAPNDGFFRVDKYRGGFGPDGQNWLCDWSALFAYGISSACGSAGTPFCIDDGAAGGLPCPCTNFGQPGRGCDNSIASGGALLTAAGSPAQDTVVFTSSGELPTAASILLQGSNFNNTGLTFGDGVRCTAGNLLRLYTTNAVGGVVVVPGPGNPSVKVRAAQLGDNIQPGANRYYQVYYRDPNLGFCPAPPGNSFNVSGALHIVW